jgi:hypothetical protein
MIPTVTSQILADHTHGVLFQYPAEFAALVNGFLDA